MTVVPLSLWFQFGMLVFCGGLVIWVAHHLWPSARRDWSRWKVSITCFYGVLIAMEIVFVLASIEIARRLFP